VSTYKTAIKTEGFVFASMWVLPVAAAFLMWLADGTARVNFSESNIFTVRYTVAVLVMMALIWPIFVYAKRRPPGTPLTWGEAMVAAVYVFFVLFWLYGIVPHEFLTWADSELAWRNDKKIIGPEGTWASWWSFWKDIPLTVDKQKIRDLVAVLLYGVGLGGFIWFWAFWNDREKKAAEAAAVQPVSRYGRPLVAKAEG
jgi:hypothetical protein